MSDQEIQIMNALREDMVIDITTVGRRSGQLRRIEIWFHNLNDELYLTGLPGPRSWAANLLSNPEFVFHLKESVRMDIPGIAQPISEENKRQQILSELLEKMKLPPERSDLDQWVAGSPLFRLELDISSAKRSDITP